MIDPDALLDVEGFDGRLRAALERARAVLGATWVTLLDRAAPNGRVEWVVRLHLGDCAPLPTTPAAMATWRAPGESGDGPLALGLDVDPPLGAAPGAWLVLGGVVGADAEQLAALRRGLERGLGADRRSRLAAIALAAVEQSLDPIEITDASATFAYVNATWQQRHGYAAEEALGQSAGGLFRDVQTPQHDSAYYEFPMRRLEAGEPWLGVIVSRAKDGRHVTSEVAVSPFRSGAGDWSGNLAVRRSLQHRIDRDRALENAHREVRALLYALRDPVVVLRGELVYFANDGFLALVGRAKAEVIGRALSEFFDPQLRAPMEARTGRDVPMRIRAADGSTRILVESTIEGVSFEGAPATVLVLRDETDRRLAAEQMAVSERLAALGALAAGVAHEINNPLTYVMVNIQSLLDGLPEGDAREIAAEALDGVRRIRQISDELRSFSRADNGPPCPTDVERAFTSALNLTGNAIRHRARVIRQHEPDLLVDVREGQLVQVLVNLLANAAESFEDERDREITVVSRSCDDRVELSVRDNGVGMTPECVARVFEPFFTTKSAGTGSGLGLAITRRIVEEAGGTISVQSEVGRGSTFTITLAASAAIEPSQAAVSRRTRTRTPIRIGATRVVLIDDDAAVARAVARMLDDCAVELIHDAEDAVRRLAAEPVPDVIVCDLMMPGRGGPDVYRTAITARPELAGRFIFVTGGAFDDATAAFLARTDVVALYKPFDAAALRGQIRARVQG